MITMMNTGKVKGIEFTTPGTTLNKLVSKGIDSDTANKVMAVASIIKGFTKNVMIVVASPNGVFRGEAWFYMKNTTEEERYNNRMSYKVLVNLIDPSIKVGAFLWPDNDNGLDDVIDVNFFGYMYNNTGNSEEQAEKEEQAMKQGRKLARDEAELWLKESAERLKQGNRPESNEDTPVNPMSVMNLWSSDEDDDTERSIESWSNEAYSFGEDE